MPANPWFTNSFIDSCAFDPKYDPEDKAAHEIFKLHEDRGLNIQIAHSTQREISHPNTPKWVKKKAEGLIYTIEVSLNRNEAAALKQIQQILAGDGKPENVADDARHIFEAQKYGSYFVTTDVRLLKKSPDIQGVEILLPNKFLELVIRHCRPTD